VREYSDSTPVPLSYVTNVPTVAGFVAALTALLVATAVVGGIALVRSAVPARLREAAP
jgi:hypothetical protein